MRSDGIISQTTTSREDAHQQRRHKDRAPAGEVDHQPGQQRPEDADNGTDGVPGTQGAPTLVAGKTLVDDGHAQRCNAGKAGPLDRPTQKQRGQGRGGHGQQRAGDKNGQAGQDQIAFTQAVAQSAIERHEDHEGQRVGRHQPGRHVGVDAEMGAQGRQRDTKGRPAEDHGHAGGHEHIEKMLVAEGGSGGLALLLLIGKGMRNRRVAFQRLLGLHQFCFAFAYKLRQTIPVIVVRSERDVNCL